MGTEIINIIPSLKMNHSQSLIKLIVFIIIVFSPITILNADNPKRRLFELLGISKDASVDGELFDLLVEKLEELCLR